MGGGTDVDFWHDLAATVRANAQRTGVPIAGDLERLAAAERYERLYSAAARMLTAQGPASARADWPEARRQRWDELEMLLATEGPADPPGTAPDPARHLAAWQDATGRPVGIAEAVRNWERQLGAQQLAASGDLDDGLVVLPGLLYLIVKVLLEELAGRLAPGRPVGAVGDGGADVSEFARDLADQLRAPVPGARSSRHTARSLPTLRAPQLLSAGLSLPAAAGRLATVARLAAEATPTPEQVAATADFAVNHGAAVAAAELLAGLRGTAGPGWRERHGDIRPDAHTISSYRWDSPGGRPVALTEWAAEIRGATCDLRPPFLSGPTDPLPESTAQSGWIALPDQAALVSAELLDELSARLRPGRWIGTIHFTAFPLQDFLRTRLSNAAIAI